MDRYGECLAALAEDVMRPADVLERPAMLLKEPDESLPVTERSYSLEVVRGKSCMSSPRSSPAAASASPALTPPLTPLAGGGSWVHAYSTARPPARTRRRR